jgi:adenylosuccinate synthase
VSGKLYVVVGGQFGSEGKGAVAGRICADLASMGRRVLNVRVGGPNAGHTVLGRCPDGCEDQHEGDRHPWRLRQVPVAAVTAPGSLLAIAAGSEVDEEVLRDELEQLDSAGYEATARLRVDFSATVLTHEHKTTEQEHGLQSRLGSTAKGIGAARADRIWRSADLARDSLMTEARLAYTERLIRSELQTGASVVIEGTQGYGLGLHTDNYPYTTSGDCRAIDFMAQAGVSPWLASGGEQIDLAVVVCLRPHPIRVAGNSGDLKGETTWDALGLPEERTTVTQKVRRVGEWDATLAKASIRANGGPRAGVVWVALTMMDSVDPTLAGQDRVQHGLNWSTEPKAARDLMTDLALPGSHLAYIGTGPDTALVNSEMYR